jgi:hypothetical protein
VAASKKEQKATLDAAEKEKEAEDEKEDAAAEKIQKEIIKPD